MEKMTLEGEQVHEGRARVELHRQWGTWERDSMDAEYCSDDRALQVFFSRLMEDSVLQNMKPNEPSMRVENHRDEATTSHKLAR